MFCNCTKQVANSIKYIEQNAQLFQYTILCLKHYTSNIFQSVVDHGWVGTTSILCKRRIKLKLAHFSVSLVLYVIAMILAEFFFHT
jgi:hypothetical protein